MSSAKLSECDTALYMKYYNWLHWIRSAPGCSARAETLWFLLRCSIESKRPAVSSAARARCRRWSSSGAERCAEAPRDCGPLSHLKREPRPELHLRLSRDRLR